MPTPDFTAHAAARARQDQLTKPRGSLGKLEDIACRFAAWQGRVVPQALAPAIAVFAGDHGVTAEGVSAYPAAVTVEMVKNFIRGGATINVLARRIGARLEVVDVGVAGELAGLDIVHAKVRPGSGNLRTGAAMTPAECEAALTVGRDAARRAIAAGANLLIAGEMGIGNTTPSACLACALGGLSPDAAVGLGTGIDDAGRRRKVAVVEAALVRVGQRDAAGWLAEVGGLEIAAMAGFYLEAAEQGVPALIDGYIAAAAALAACALEPATRDWLLASHCSQEQGHRQTLAAIGLEPLIDFGLRVGEGSGAALLVPLLQSAIALHAEMATFAEAGVSDRED